MLAPGVGAATTFASVGSVLSYVSVTTFQSVRTMPAKKKPSSRKACEKCARPADNKCQAGRCLLHCATTKSGKNCKNTAHRQFFDRDPKRAKAAEASDSDRSEYGGTEASADSPPTKNRSLETGNAAPSRKRLRITCPFCEETAVGVDGCRFCKQCCDKRGKVCDGHEVEVDELAVVKKENAQLRLENVQLKARVEELEDELDAAYDGPSDVDGLPAKTVPGGLEGMVTAAKTLLQPSQSSAAFGPKSGSGAPVAPGGGLFGGAHLGQERAGDAPAHPPVDEAFQYLSADQIAERPDKWSDWVLLVDSIPARVDRATSLRDAIVRVYKLGALKTDEYRKQAELLSDFCETIVRPFSNLTQFRSDLCVKVCAHLCRLMVLAESNATRADQFMSAVRAREFAFSPFSTALAALPLDSGNGGRGARGDRTGAGGRGGGGRGKGGSRAEKKKQKRKEWIAKKKEKLAAAAAANDKEKKKS